MKLLTKLIVIVFMLPLSMVHAETAANSLTQKLAAIQSLKAKFNQTVSGGKLIGEEHYQGEVLIKKPNHFRWEVKKPSQQTIISDGKNLTVFDHDLEQVTIQPVADTIQDSPALLLSGETKNLTHHYDIRYKKIPTGDYYTLIAKGNDPIVTMVSLTFHQGLIQEMVLIDGMSQKSIFTFSEVAQNTIIQDKVFQFTIPAGADVIGASTP